MNPSESARLSDADINSLAQYLEAEFSTAVDISRASYPHRLDASRRIGVIRGTDMPKQGVITWCTLGLAHLSWSGSAARFELVAALKNGEFEFGKVLATIAHTMKDQNVFPRPGLVMADAVRACSLGKLSEQMPHGLFVNPYTWDKCLDRTEVSVGKVWMMQIVPIYHAEYEFIKTYSFDAFEEILMAKGVALIDPTRRNCLEYDLGNE